MVASPFRNRSSDDGDYLSDDSEFYGATPTKAFLQAALRATSPNAFWRIHSSLPSVLAYKALNTRTSNGIVSNSIAQEKYTSNIPSAPPSHRQPNETTAAFLERVPPLTTSASFIGPWIWISNPHIPRSTGQSVTITAFKTLGAKLLSSYLTHEADIRSAMHGKPAGSITRKLTPLRKQLELDIRAAAAETGCVSGKWMLFPAEEDLDRIWLEVCKGVVVGKLGTGAKVASAGSEHRGGERLICVYTEDFGDEADVRRVLEALVEMDLVGDGGGDGYDSGGGRAIYYKCDAYTYLGIDSKNEYAIKASIYASRDMLKSTPTTKPNQR